VGQQALQVQQAKQELPEEQALQVLQDLLVQAQQVQQAKQELPEEQALQVLQDLLVQAQQVQLDPQVLDQQVQQDLQVKVLLVLLE
jgi:hypothetical protein